VDSHAHIDLPVFDHDRDQVLARARRQGVRAIVNVGLNLKSSQASLDIARRYPNVFTAVGFHPSSASGMREGDLDLLGELAGDSRVVAIGEIGVDLYRKSCPRERQLEVFQRQLDLAAELDLPVVIHCRQAHKEVLNMLAHWVKSTSSSASNHRELGVAHCFSGDAGLAWRYIELGFLVSLAGTVTYPSARDRVRVAREVPLDKLLVETDSPFLAPQLHRGQRNEPSYVSLVVDKIAETRHVPREHIIQATEQNAIRLFCLPYS
jgi:TatD DNase family protein